MEANVATGEGAMDIGVLDKLYEPKHNKKIFRIITVIAYIFSVSMVAILLSLYYLFLWDPYIKAHNEKMAAIKRQEEVGSPFGFDSPLDPEVSAQPSSLPPLDNFFDSPLPKPLAFKQPEEDIEDDKTLISLKPQLKWVTLTTNAGDKTVQAKSYSSILEDPFTTYAKALRAKSYSNLDEKDFQTKSSENVSNDPK